VFRNLYLEKTHGSHVLKSEHSYHAPHYVLEGDELIVRGVVPHMRRELLSLSYAADWRLIICIGFDTNPHA